MLPILLSFSHECGFYRTPLFFRFCFGKGNSSYIASDSFVRNALLSDEILRYIYEYGYTDEQIASAMFTDINLIELKVAHLATLGYNLHALEHKSNFLK